MFLGVNASAWGVGFTGTGFDAGKAGSNEFPTAAHRAYFPTQVCRAAFRCFDKDCDSTTKHLSQESPLLLRTHPTSQEPCEPPCFKNAEPATASPLCTYCQEDNSGQLEPAELVDGYLLGNLEPHEARSGPPYGGSTSSSPGGCGL